MKRRCREFTEEARKDVEIIYRTIREELKGKKGAVKETCLRTGIAQSTIRDWIKRHRWNFDVNIDLNKQIDIAHLRPRKMPSRDDWVKFAKQLYPKEMAKKHDVNERTIRDWEHFFRFNCRRICCRCKEIVFGEKITFRGSYPYCEDCQGLPATKYSFRKEDLYRVDPVFVKWIKRKISKEEGRPSYFNSCYQEHLNHDLS